MPPINPYESPQSDEAKQSQQIVSAREYQFRSVVALVVSWMIVFGVNCIWALFPPNWFHIHWLPPEWAGKVGIGIGLIILMTLGIVLCMRFRRLAMATVYGGVLLALTQLMPGLQLMGLGFGVIAARQISNTKLFIHAIAFDFTGGIVTVVVTGFLLLGVATLIGLFILAVIPHHWRIARIAKAT